MNGDLFDRLEHELRMAAPRVAAPRRRRRFTRPWRAPLALAGAALIVTGGALAATGTVHFGPPLAPSKAERPDIDTGAARPGDRGRVLTIRVADPAGGAPWGVRVFRSTRGYECAQIGRVVEGRLVALGRGGRARDLALRCSVNASYGYGWTNGVVFGERQPHTFVHGNAGRRARRVVVKRGETSVVAGLDGGFFLAVFPSAFRDHHLPGIYVELDDGSTVRLDTARQPIPGAEPPPRPEPPRAGRVEVTASARTIGPTEPVTVSFRAPVALKSASLFFRAEANGPHASGCAGRGVAGTRRNYNKGDKVTIRVSHSEPWCRGHFQGTVRMTFKQAIGSFAFDVR